MPLPEVLERVSVAAPEPPPWRAGEWHAERPLVRMNPMVPRANLLHLIE